MKVADVMTKSVRSCAPSCTLNEAAREMWENDCGVVPVVDTSRTVVGMITDRDICMAAYTRGRPLNEIPVEQVMARKLLACRPDSSLTEAEETMRTAQVRRLPVTDERGALVGLITLNDIARAATAPNGRAAKSPDIKADVVLRTLAGIGERRISRR